MENTLSPCPLIRVLSNLSDLVLNSDTVMIVGHVNIHVDVEKGSLTTAFKSLLHSVGFSQNVNEPTHCFNHTLDHVLSSRIENENVIVLHENPPSSDHFWVTSQFTIMDTNDSEKIVITVDISPKSPLLNLSKWLYSFFLHSDMAT